MAHNPTSTDARPSEAGPPPAPRARGRRWLFPLLAGVVLAAAGGFAAYSFTRAHTSQPPPLESIRATGIPSTVPTRVAGVMSLQAVRGRQAPAFTLTDQNGHTVSMSTFRGHVVVLEFMDPHCRTICPIVAQEFVEAEHRLAGRHLGVVFLAVNVNRHALSVATVAAFTDEHQLNTIPTWHFLTGKVATLHRTWTAYGIEVRTRIVKGQWTPIHSSLVFFIGPGGKERYLAAPVDDHTKSGRAYLPTPQLSAWGRGIALVAESLAR